MGTPWIVDGSEIFIVRLLLYICMYGDFACNFESSWNILKHFSELKYLKSRQVVGQWFSVTPTGCIVFQQGLSTRITSSGSNVSSLTFLRHTSFFCCVRHKICNVVKLYYACTPYYDLIYISIFRVYMLTCILFFFSLQMQKR